MIPEMYEINQGHGLDWREAAKMELATSLAMLSSSAITTFWLLFHIFSDAVAVGRIREELHAITTDVFDSFGAILKTKVLNLSEIKKKCPTLVGMLNETLRFHSTVINIKQVQQNTILANHYLLKKDGLIMIPGRSIHHNSGIWGANAYTFDHERFTSSHSRNKLLSTSAFRPFGAGVTMCPGRHFSTNVILSLVVMVVLQYDVVPNEGEWKVPTTRNADFWNAMPEPDWDVEVRLVKRVETKVAEYTFLWKDGDA